MSYDTFDITAASFGFNEDLLTSKQIRKLRKKERKHKQHTQKVVDIRPTPTPGFRPANDRQKALVRAIQDNPQSIALGAAGTGKTYVTTCMGVSYLKQKAVTQFIVSKPNVSGGGAKSIGFIPGDKLEKMEGWVSPILGIMRNQLGRAVVDIMLRNQQIEIIPFEYMRGHSFQNAYVMLDEAQNATISELELLVTRIGEGSKLVISGDLRQTDTKNSGLQQLMDIAWKGKVEIPVVEFTFEDIVRSGICKEWVKAFQQYK